MCGIVGKFFFNKSRFYDDDLDKMLQSIVHRGPDSAGRYGDGRALLGFRRLSIIDTITGDQPLFSEDGQVVVIANGEIYNYLELRKFLVAKGHIFKTGSDCEVIVHLYEEFGQNFVERLNGIFAFCLYDRRKKMLLLARDRVGVKPLYFARRDDVLIFGSEIKAILQAKEVDPVENPDVLDEYLCFRSLSGTRTFFSGVDLLSPGVILKVTPEEFSLRKYWYPTLRDILSSDCDKVQLVHDTLCESVARQLMADVPLGTQLSGGVDSSWVSTLASYESPGMKSFTVAFEERAFDETREAELVAGRAGLEYHNIISDPANFGSMLPRVIWHNDEPLTHANSVEIYNLCRYAREHVKVLLTGEGADELFGGYPRYYLCKFGQGFSRLPSVLQPVFRFAADFLSRGRGKKPSTFFGMTPRDMVFWNSNFTNPETVAWLMDKDELNLADRRTLLDKSWHEPFALLDNLLIFEFQSYLQPILLRQDKMSMGASIEARVPILDNAMVDLAFSITATDKIKYLKPKYLFKKAAERDLPANIVHKKKVGFGVPVGKWMRGNGTLGKYLDHLLEHRLSLPGINSRKLEQIINKHRMGIVDHQAILWPLLNYSIWRDIFFNRKSDFF